MKNLGDNIFNVKNKEQEIARFLLNLIIKNNEETKQFIEKINEFGKVFESKEDKETFDKLLQICFKNISLQKKEEGYSKIIKFLLKKCIDNARVKNKFVNLLYDNEEMFYFNDVEEIADAFPINSFLELLDVDNIFEKAKIVKVYGELIEKEDEITDDDLNLFSKYI